MDGVRERDSSMQSRGSKQHGDGHPGPWCQSAAVRGTRLVAFRLDKAGLGTGRTAEEWRLMQFGADRLNNVPRFVDQKGPRCLDNAAATRRTTVRWQTGAPHSFLLAALRRADARLCSWADGPSPPHHRSQPWGEASSWGGARPSPGPCHHSRAILGLRMGQSGRAERRGE
jgi:hypothetical protein